MKNSKAISRMEIRRRCETGLRSHCGRAAMRMASSLLLVAFVFGAAAFLRAQVDNARAGIVFYPAPPASFNPIKASDEELAEYGFPPRPDQSNPALYAHWQRIVRAATKRPANVGVRTTNVRHGVVRDRQDQGTIASASTSTINCLSSSSTACSSNWSGYVISASAGTFNVNNTLIEGEWTVPSVPAWIENCAYAPYQTSIWVGIDGWSNNAIGNGDVLQAGTSVYACNSSPNNDNLPTAWFEWWTAGCLQNSYTTPCLETSFSGFSISPGDDVDTEVWYTTTTTPPQGHAAITDFTTGFAIIVGIYQPEIAGVVQVPCSSILDPGPCYSPGEVPAPGLQGSSAEWIVEQPCHIGNPCTAYYNLADYQTLAMSFAEGWIGDSVPFSPSSAPAEATAINVTMTCIYWNPSSACSSSYQDSSIVQLGQLGATQYDGNTYSPPGGPILWFTPMGPPAQ